MNFPENVTVIPGCVKVVSVARLYANEQVQLWSIDASTKYYQLQCSGFDDNAISVYLGANENTIKTDEDHLEEDTIVKFVFDNEHWYLFSCNSFARYELRLCFYRFNQSIDIQV